MEGMMEGGRPPRAASGEGCIHGVVATRGCMHGAMRCSSVER